MRALVIDGARVVVGDRELIGAGGEAEVFALPEGRVAKVFTTPSPLHRQKIEALRALSSRLPAEAVAPDGVVTDELGEVLGYTMPRVEAPFRPAAELMRRPSFVAVGLPERVALIVRLARAVRRLHALGVIVGDLSDQNVLVEPARGDVRLIDLDSCQLGGLACPVQTDAYVDPAAPRTGTLAPSDDEYALHVLATRLLLGVHPWGGVHATLTTSEARARARVFVADPGVTYPTKVAQPPRSIGAPLLAALGEFFRASARVPVAETGFTAVALSASRCGACGASGVPDAGVCPSCACRAALQPTAAIGDDAHELDGPTEWLDAVGDTIAVLARARGGVGVHTCVRGVWRTLPHARAVGLVCALIDDARLAVADGDRLELWDLASSSLLSVTTTTESWGGAIVARLDGALVRATGARLVLGDEVLGRAVDRLLGDVVPGQARVFSAAPGATRVIVATRLGRQVMLERLGPRERRALPLTPLSMGEALLELDALDDGSSTLCARLTRERGATLVRHDLFASDGHLVASSRVLEGSHPARVGLAGRALRGLVLLHPTRDGLVREQLVHGRVGDAAALDGTRDAVDEGSLLVACERGLVVASDRSVRLLRPRASTPTARTTHNQKKGTP